VTVSVQVIQTNSDFCASLAGSPELRCVRPSREEAIAALQSQLAQKIAIGELLTLDIPLGVTAMAGRFRDDPELGEICESIYRDRDSDRPS
jgi:hypothetical protein